MCVVRGSQLESRALCALSHYKPSTSYRPHATSRLPVSKPPHPDPPPRGGSFASWAIATGALTSPRSSGGHMGPPLRRDNTHHEPQATGHKLQATCRFSPTPRTRSARSRSRAHAGREAVVLLLQACKCWNVGEGLKPSPTGRKPEAGHGTSTGHKLRATSHPVTVTTNQVLRTTNQ